MADLTRTFLGRELILLLFFSAPFSSAFSVMAMIIIYIYNINLNSFRNFKLLRSIIHRLKSWITRNYL